MKKRLISIIAVIAIAVVAGYNISPCGDKSTNES